MTMPVGAGKNACFGYEDEPSAASCADPDAQLSRAPAEELVCRGPEARGTLEPMHAAADGCALTPDYYTLSASAGFGVVAVGSATIDRYGHTYTAGGAGLGSGVGGAAHVGYLRDPEHPCDPPDEATLRSFLSGPAVSIGGGAGLGVGVTHSSGMTSREIGLSTPQLGTTVTLGAEHGRNRS